MEVIHPSSALGLGSGIPAKMENGEASHPWGDYAQMRVDLKVPYHQKAEAKALGARWDVGRRIWYVENKENLVPFLKWMPPHLTKRYVK